MHHSCGCDAQSFDAWVDLKPSASGGAYERLDGSGYIDGFDGRCGLHAMPVRSDNSACRKQLSGSCASALLTSWRISSEAYGAALIKSALCAHPAKSSSVFGTALQTTPEIAAFANGSMVCFLDDNDGYMSLPKASQYAAHGGTTAIKALYLNDSCCGYDTGRTRLLKSF